MDTDTELVSRLKAAYKVDIPGRMEIDTVSRMLASQGIETSSCLDLGFHNPVASQQLRELGGYWTSTVWTGAERRQAAAVLGEDVFQVGVGDELESKLNASIYSFGLATIGNGSVIPANVTIGKNTAIKGVTDMNDYPNNSLEGGGYIIKAGDVA